MTYPRAAAAGWARSRAPNLPYAPNVSRVPDRPYAPKRPYPRAGTRAPASRAFSSRAPVGRGTRGRSAVATAIDAIVGARASRVSAAGSGSGTSAARNPAAAPSNGMPVRSPRRWRKRRRASIEPSVQDSAVVVAEMAIRRAGPRPIADRPGRGRVAGSVRATATAKYTVAASGVRHQASRSSAAAVDSGWLIAWPRVHRNRKPVPADATATSRRRSCTAGRAPRVRRRASTRPGLPTPRAGAGARCARAARPAGTPCGRRGPRSPRRGWRGRP